MSSSDASALEALQSFFEQGLITDIVSQLKSGKEATVYHCRANPDTGHRNVAAKVYHERSARSFRNDAIYRAGRMEYARNSRVRRALEGNSAFGREVRHKLWIADEWTTLRAMYDAGVDCPQPIAQSETAILMSFVGDDNGPAPQLREAANIGQELADQILSTLLDNIALMLDAHRVHGDLSPYNVLLWHERPTIIDFPQAIDPRLNPAAGELLRRDILAVCEWAKSHAVEACCEAIFTSMWRDFVMGRRG